MQPTLLSLSLHHADGITERMPEGDDLRLYPLQQSSTRGGRRIQATSTKASKELHQVSGEWTQSTTNTFVTKEASTFSKQMKAVAKITNFTRIIRCPPGGRTLHPHPATA
jgi:hypothetical protein